MFLLKETSFALTLDPRVIQNTWQIDLSLPIQLVHLFQDDFLELFTCKSAE